ncbi:MAG: hypothetical protein MJK04_01655, partial [Psychrosphaera sp.]|nr:hypothetical protein [Psychrosphaera sp.]
SCNGCNTITQQKSQPNNLLGERTSVTDDAGIITYEYNAVGNLSTTTGVDSAQIITNYDDYGHKTSMVDPDKGTWSYTYNGLGELASQTDARLFTTTYLRDTVGRTTSRSVTGNSTNETTTYTFAAHQFVAEQINGSQFKRCYGYDILGRGNQTTTVLDGRDCYVAGEGLTIAGAKYTQWSTFDEVGRVFQQFDAKGDNFGAKSSYQNGYLKTQYEARYSGGTDKPKLMEIGAMDALGNVTSITDGNGKTTSKTYNLANGLIDLLITDDGKLQDIDYQFDGAGNLRYRNNTSTGIEQHFTFDNFNRLLTATGYQDKTLTYDTNGNILTKSDVQGNQTYQYANGSTGSHALTRVGNLSYQYDANGNQTQAFDGTTQTRDVTYSHFDKPTEIDAYTNGTTDFIYGPSRSRYQRTDTVNNETTVTYYIGNVEVVILPSGTVETKRYVANALQISRSNGTVKTQYLYKDHLGSLDTVTNEAGKIESKLYFDPFGQRNTIAEHNWSSISQAVAAQTLNEITKTTNRGFTGHEHIDTANIIHMNGRIYDPVTARFMQADPIVQAPDNSQNLNRYSYVLNNPLRYTDPSGFSFRSLGRFINKWLPTVFIAIIGSATGGLGATIGEMMAGGAMAGWVSSDFNFRGAVIGALSAGINSFAGGSFSSALIGGALSKVQGGKFGHGFISAGLGAALGGNYGANPLANVVKSAVIGGSISVLTGGKFANGAVSAAFASALRQDWGAAPEVEEIGAANNSNLSDRRIKTMARKLKRKFEEALTVGGDKLDAYCLDNPYHCNGMSGAGLKKVKYKWQKSLFRDGQDKHSTNVTGAVVDRFAEGGPIVRLYAGGLVLQGRSSIFGLAEALLHEYRHLSKTGTTLHLAWPKIRAANVAHAKSLGERYTIPQHLKPYEVDAFGFSEKVMNYVK